MTRRPDHNARFHQRLERIARAIGVPVRSFYDKEDGSAASDWPTLARLFAAITDVQGRQRVMNVARREAERCQGCRRPEPE